MFNNIIINYEFDKKSILLTDIIYFNNIRIFDYYYNNKLNLIEISNIINDMLVSGINMEEIEKECNIHNIILGNYLINDNYEISKIKNKKYVNNKPKDLPILTIDIFSTNELPSSYFDLFTNNIEKILNDKSSGVVLEKVIDNTIAFLENENNDEDVVYHITGNKLNLSQYIVDKLTSEIKVKFKFISYTIYRNLVYLLSDDKIKEIINDISIYNIFVDFFNKEKIIFNKE